MVMAGIVVVFVILNVKYFVVSTEDATGLVIGTATGVAEPRECDHET